MTNPTPLNVGIDWCLRNTTTLAYANLYAMPPVRRAILPVSTELLVQALALPTATEVIGAGMSRCGRYVELLVESDQLKEIPPDCVLPVMTVQFEKFDGRIVKSEWCNG